MNSPRRTRASILGACAIACVLIHSSGATAQAPSASETAASFVVATPQTTPLRDAPGPRLVRARRLRITGIVLLASSVAMVGTMAAIYTTDHTCDSPTASTWVCFDGPKLGAAMGAAMASPFFLTGVALTSSGFAIERRQRSSLAIGPTSFRFTF